MYKLILTLLLLTAQQSIQAQVTLYQTPEGKLLTQHQLDSIRLDLEKKMTALKMKVQLNTSPISTRNDTTFLSFNLKFFNHKKITLHLKYPPPQSSIPSHY